MPFTPKLQQLVDNSIITPECAEQLHPETVTALESECFDVFFWSASLLSAAQLETIAAISPNYVGRILKDPRLINLIQKNWLTVEYVKKLTTPEQYEWIFQEEWQPIHFANRVVTPKFIELIADENFRYFCSHPNVNHELMVIRGVGIGEVAYRNIKTLMHECSFSKQEVYALSNQPTNLAIFINNPIATQGIASIIKHGIMSKEAFLNTDNPTRFALLNTWILLLLSMQKMSLEDFYAIKQDYLANHSDYDNTKHATINIDFIRDRLRATITESPSSLNRFIVDLTHFAELCKNLPELRELVVLKVLNSKSLFDRVNKHQRDYGIFREYCAIKPLAHWPALYLSEHLLTITQEPKLEKARVQQRSMLQQREIRLSALILAKAMHEQASPLSLLPLDIITVIAALTANDEGGLSNEEKIRLADQSIARRMQFYTRLNRNDEANEEDHASNSQRMSQAIV